MQSRTGPTPPLGTAFRRTAAGPPPRASAREDLFLLPIDGGEPRTVGNTKDLDFIRWSGDGKFIFGVVSGSIPAQVVRIEVASGKRETWKELAPSDRSGLIGVGSVFLTPDGKNYVYGYGRAATSDLTSSTG